MQNAPNTPADRIAELFKAFTGRFGALDLKDGQDMAYVQRSWQNSVGRYSWSDIQIAMRACFASAKYTRWPEEGPFLEILRDCGFRPEGKAQIDSRPPHVKDAERDAARWWHGQISHPLPEGAWPCGWTDVVLHLIGADQPANRRKTFSEMLTAAWLRGDIPVQFEQKARAYFATAQERKAQYMVAIAQHGLRAVNSGEVKF